MLSKVLEYYQKVKSYVVNLFSNTGKGRPKKQNLIDRLDWEIEKRQQQEENNTEKKTMTYEGYEIDPTEIKPSEIFDKALSFLWDGVDYVEYPMNGKREFICHCLDQVYESFGSKTNVDFCNNIVDERLGSSGTLAFWLHYKGYATSEEIDNNQQKLQETRRQWLISLRDEFKAKGL